MNDMSEEFQYVTGQMRSSFAPLFVEFEKRNEQSISQTQWVLNAPYGPHERELFDLLPTELDSQGTVIYFHAGYWQTRDKAQFRFLAPAFNALGWDAALVNYPLCPEVSISDIVNSARMSIEHVANHQVSKKRHGPLVLCGHSAGAHLVVELALQLGKHHHNLGLPLAGVLPISGIFDLEPLMATSLNQRLRLTQEEARACSPLHRVSSDLAPALFLVGETETQAFHDQTQNLTLAWQAHGNRAECHRERGADHFSILDQLCSTHGVVAQILKSWAQQKS
jgi:arylformamidase